MKIIQLVLAAAIVPALAWAQLAQLQAAKGPGAWRLFKVEKKLVDCADMPSSLEKIAADLLGNDPGSSFQGSVLDAGDAAYEESRKQYATSVVPTFPTHIVRALGAVDVQAAVTFAARCGYSVTTRSGGHSYLGISSCDGSQGPCIQVDVGGLNGIEGVELPGGQGKQLRIGPGAILNDIVEVFVQSCRPESAARSPWAATCRPEASDLGAARSGRSRTTSTRSRSSWPTGRWNRWKRPAPVPRPR